MEDFEEDVIEPMMATQELILSRPYATRLYTTLSAPEMDLDPLFDFNPDLLDVSNNHVARRVIECSRRVYQEDAPTRFELEDGRTVRLHQGDPWPFDVDDEDAPPANSKILALTTSGPGTVLEDNDEPIEEAAVLVFSTEHDFEEDPQLAPGAGRALERDPRSQR